MTLTQTADRLLTEATASRAIPGVVAMATTADGTIYEGAFGKASLAEDRPMALDTVFHIASMTKAIAGAGAMQLVEQGRIGLDQPAGEIIGQLGAPQVLDGFDAAGAPKLRPARGTITLRNLLTHTAGYAYDMWNAELARFYKVTGLPAARTGRLEALTAPLASDPGTRWEYGINIDWVGRIVEAISGQNLNDYLRSADVRSARHARFRLPAAPRPGGTSGADPRARCRWRPDAAADRSAARAGVLQRRRRAVFHRAAIT